MNKNPVVLITGGSRGIGAGIASEFAGNGYNVVINFLQDKKKADELLEKIRTKKGTARLYQADITDSSGVKKMVEDILKNEGRIDVLINNAGVIVNKSILKTDDSDWEKVIKTDLTGAFYLIKECSGVMARQKSGSIVNITSIVGARGVGGSSGYASAKAGLMGLTKSAARELGRFNICVNAVMPGFHLTDMGKEASDKYMELVKNESVLKRTTDIDELAKFIVFLSGMKTVSGQVFNWDSRII
ncbi:MAG: SDR family NAD(P)-dependent oxidoreductase [Endomicrobiales bacterium]|nr:SDR family NAD(P)-dependent oxidoreductase [Endomicrobiales bacterium]